MTQSSEMPDEDKGWKTRSKRKVKTFRLEYRIRPDKLPSLHHFLLDTTNNNEWKTYHARYSTAAQRQMAMNTMNRKNDMFEYRLPLEGVIPL